MNAFKTICRAISHILSTLLCLLLSVVVLATMLVADLRVATNKDNLQNVLNNILSAPPQVTLGPISASTTLGPDMDFGSLGFDFDIGSLLTGEGNLTESVIEYALEILEESNVEIEKEAIEQFVEESTIKEYIADKSSSIISDIVTGENTTTITGEEIKELLTENKELIEEHFDIVITEEEIEEVAQAVEELPVVQEIQKNGVAGFLGGGMTVPDGSYDESTDSTTPSNPMGGINEILNTVRMIASDTVFYACIGACAILIALLFLLAWNKPYIALFYSGSTFFTTGLTFLVPTLIATTQPATWIGLFSNIPEIGAMIGAVSRVVLMLTGSVCYTVTGIGLALFVLGIVVFAVMKKIKKAKAAKAAAAPITETAPVAEETAPAEEVAPVEEVVAEEDAPAEEVVAEEDAPAEEVAAEEDAPAEETEPAEVPNA